MKNSVFCPAVFMMVTAITFTGCKKDSDSPTQSNPVTGKSTAVFNPSVTYGTMTDLDGNVYKTVTIGTQTWMAENLRTTRYNDGTSIPDRTDITEWSHYFTGAYCNYNNTKNADSIATYGRLYNWYAVQSGKLAPQGWHVPSDAEWTSLTNYLGGAGVAGGKLKETGTMHWSSPNTESNNESGFTALPGGLRYSDGAFSALGSSGYWWSSSESSAQNPWYRWLLGNNYNGVRRFQGTSKMFGFSVRCVRD